MESYRQLCLALGNLRDKAKAESSRFCGFFGDFCLEVTQAVVELIDVLFDAFEAAMKLIHRFFMLRHQRNMQRRHLGFGRRSPGVCSSLRCSGILVTEVNRGTLNGLSGHFLQMVLNRFVLEILEIVANRWVAWRGLVVGWRCRLIRTLTVQAGRMVIGCLSIRTGAGLIHGLCVLPQSRSGYILRIAC